MTIFFLYFQLGDFLLLHLLGQNISVTAFSELLTELCKEVVDRDRTPSAPASLEMHPFYNSENEKETMT